MKLNGQQISGVYVETVVIPRPSKFVPKKDENGEPILEGGKPVMEELPQFHAFKLQAVLSYDDFEKMCPAPVAPPMILKGGIHALNTEAPEYKKEIKEWAEKRYAWAFLKSISATPDLEWDTVDMENPETWKLYEKELQAAGFSVNEIGRLYNGFAAANALSEDKMEEARKHFLAMTGER